MNQAQRVLQEVKQAPRRRRTPLEGLAESLETNYQPHREEPSR
jgi:hypothetical protein